MKTTSTVTLTPSDRDPVRLEVKKNHHRMFRIPFTNTYIYVNVFSVIRIIPNDETSD